ncbi:archease [uncultured Methanomethylovorans sp.]|uniref:archease n=1 Tax=uncultured Methanomethylovorans sp. TaxID=183759 RepID=UPI002AA7A953|nr:archease [uncultured Methanomethylovorans sp.]
MPDAPKKYEYLDHTADAKFLAYGKTLEEAFENAALAMFNVMINTNTISNTLLQDIDLVAEDIDGLLFDWLSEFLFLMDAENLIFGDFKVHSIKQKGGKFYLSATVYGELIDLSRHVFDTEVKAATYNNMQVKNLADGWVLQATVDT